MSKREERVARQRAAKKHHGPKPAYMKRKKTTRYAVLSRLRRSATKMGASKTSPLRWQRATFAPTGQSRRVYGEIEKAYLQKRAKEQKLRNIRQQINGTAA